MIQNSLFGRGRLRNIASMETQDTTGDAQAVNIEIQIHLLAWDAAVAHFELPVMKSQKELPGIEEALRIQEAFDPFH
jgi:hypothetical protein